MLCPFFGHAPFANDNASHSRHADNQSIIAPPLQPPQHSSAPCPTLSRIRVEGDGLTRLYVSAIDRVPTASFHHRTSSTMTDSLLLGQTIELNDGRQAVIRFLGTTHFAGGDWIGVELENASGKNDGSVQGQRYFDCEREYGMFIRETAVSRVVEQPQVKASAKSNGKLNGQLARPRPSSGIVNGLRRQSTIDATSRRQSLNNASPTPGARGIGTPSGLRVCRSSINCTPF